MAGPSLSPLLVVLLSLALASVGQGAQDTGERIVNGVPCPRGSQPWQVALFQGREFRCAGVLIHEQWVLTVAHCYMHEYTVQLGSALLADENAQRINTTKSFIHPKYDVATNVHDIRLLKLSSPVTLSQTVKTARVPSRCKPAGTNCTVPGWGSTSMYRVKNAPELMCLNVKIISYKECRRFYPTLLRTFMMCAAPPYGISFACKGDSGGPVICDRSLEGLVSTDTFPCLSPFEPVVYTRLCRYYKWIHRTIKNNS